MLNIFAAKISTYGRVTAMTAEESSAPYRIVPTDARDPKHRERHPFAKTPAVEIDGIWIYETAAICQYIDDVFNEGQLQPKGVEARARMTQWISITNQYLYGSTEYGLVMPRLVVPRMGGLPREDLIEDALPTIAYQMAIVSNRLEESPYLAGRDFSLADIFMYVILDAVDLTPEGQMILAELLPLKHWLDKVGERESAIATRWQED
jgi:glutathione S-transferase